MPFLDRREVGSLREFCTDPFALIRFFLLIILGMNVSFLMIFSGGSWIFWLRGRILQVCQERCWWTGRHSLPTSSASLAMWFRSAIK